MKTYQILENGELYWRGKAHDPNHAEERAFWDDQPGSLCRYTLQEYKKIKVGANRVWGWFTHYKNEPIYLW
jgi:hypothetical protein